MGFFALDMALSLHTKARQSATKSARAFADSKVSKVHAVLSLTVALAP
ncbi:hypothetical protein TR2A62_0425 [Thalassobium sp. R2A62]|nr:hypothetical protein TR2A62_0425 [Thalassobium sp. R2A62]